MYVQGIVNAAGLPPSAVGSLVVMGDAVPANLYTDAILRPPPLPVSPGSPATTAGRATATWHAPCASPCTFLPSALMIHTTPMTSAKSAKWRERRDPLWRGDSAAGLSRPAPRANASIVRHILYLDGAGRDTPYHSTSEVHDMAAHFAGKAGGRVYRTTVSTAQAAGVGHISRIELLGLLRDKGHGDAQWNSAYEVMTARRYVEEWSEHLLSYRHVPVGTDLDSLLATIYS